MGCYHSRAAKSTNTVDNCREAANRTSLELSQDQNSQYVKSALSQFLVGYETQYIIGNETKCNPGTVNPNDIKSIMEVEKKSSILLSPDPTGKFLSYGLQPTRYVLYYNRKPPNSVKFLYQWEEGRETFITSPYIPSNAGDGIPVPCAPRINLTCHLLKGDPVPGIIEALGQLRPVVSGVSDPNMGLVGPEFEWNHSGAFPIEFKVMSGTRLHWKEVIGDFGEIKLTNNHATALILKLVGIQ